MLTHEVTSYLCQCPGWWQKGATFGWKLPLMSVVCHLCVCTQLLRCFPDTQASKSQQWGRVPEVASVWLEKFADALPWFVQYVTRQEGCGIFLIFLEQSLGWSGLLFVASGTWILMLILWHPRNSELSKMSNKWLHDLKVSVPSSFLPFLFIYLYLIFKKYPH